jgi:hypothetical protein
VSVCGGRPVAVALRAQIALWHAEGRARKDTGPLARGVAAGGGPVGDEVCRAVAAWAARVLSQTRYFRAASHCAREAFLLRLSCV